MRKILSTLFIAALFSSSVSAQYFQGTFTNNANVLTFKMRPTGNMTTEISYLEASFRYNIATTPAFTVGAITTNLANFPSMNIQRLPDYTDGTYNYIRFVHNTGVIVSKSYIAATEYPIFTLTLGGSPSFGSFDMSSDLVTSYFAFGVVDGAGVFIDPGSADQLYGPGFFKAGDAQFVPLINVPLPVKFLGFTAIKNKNSALLNWTVDNEGTLTDKYEVERSSNGRDFKSISTIAPKNNGNTSNTYLFTQENLSGIRSNGIIYFRVKQTDKDGKFIYTDIKNVRVNSKGLAIGVYPNPIKAMANVSFDLEAQADVILTVSDASGKQLFIKQVQGFKGANINTINMSNFATGNYMLKFQVGNDVQTLPIVKSSN